MRRVAWTDERLDDLARRMDAGFEGVDRDIRDLRGEIRAGFGEVRSEIDGLRTLIFRGGVAIVGSVVATVVAGTLAQGL